LWAKFPRVFRRKPSLTDKRRTQWPFKTSADHRTPSATLKRIAIRSREPRLSESAERIYGKEKTSNFRFFALADDLITCKLSSDETDSQYNY
jgi:hypothetical protein